MAVRMMRKEFQFEEGAGKRTQTQVFDIGPVLEVQCFVSGFEFAFTQEARAGAAIAQQGVSARIVRIEGKPLLFR